MEGELWKELYQWIEVVDKQHLQPPAKYSDATIVQLHLWSVLHDRPTYWACETDHWNGSPLRPPELPSQPTMSRRLRSAGVIRFLGEMEQAIRNCLVLLPLRLVSWIDGKPLPVPRHSKDPDQDRGHGQGQAENGYKLHGLWDDRLIPLHEETPMSTAESKMARRLFRHLDDQQGGYILGDSQYDSNDLHRRSAARQHQLVAPPKKRHRQLGHRPHQPARLHSLEMQTRPFGRDLLHLRSAVERLHGNWCSFGGGLLPLPAWVRRLHRVKRWVQGKLLINACRIRLNLERVAA